MSTEKPKKASKVQTVPRMHLTKVAALVKKTRAAKNMSLRELALAAGLSHQQILRVEHGVCSVESALAVLTALQVPKVTQAKVISTEMYKLAMAS